jgi:hypothetical protein
MKESVFTWWLKTGNKVLLPTLCEEREREMLGVRIGFVHYELKGPGYRVEKRKRQVCL